MTLAETILIPILSFLSNTNVVIALATIVIFTVYWYASGPKNRPPGPLGLPIVGYLPFLGLIPHQKFQELAKIYGPVFSTYFGNRLVVVLNSYDAIKEAYIKNADVFAGRPHNMNFTAAPSDTNNIVVSDGTHWKEHRRFAMTVLRDLGVGKLSIEPKIMEEIQHFLSELKKFNGKPFNFSELMALSISNNICIPLFGKRFEYDDPWFISAKRYFDKIVSFSSALSMFSFFPWMKHIPGMSKLTNQEDFIQTQEKFKETMHIIINEKKKRHHDGQRDDYMNAFLTEMNARNAKNSPDEFFKDISLEDNARTLMVAGTETSANTMQFCILCMMCYPEVQRKVQEEIDEVIGPERTSCYSDRLRTPYTEATICEVQRMFTLVPNNVPHRNFEECKILGYTIPKDSFIMSNLWAVHNDPKLWKDPEVFRPERFLTATGEFVRDEHLIPFSVGKRQCLGENLARMELYLYFTSMLQKFTFKSDEPGGKPNMELRFGITVSPKHFNPCAILRNIK